MLLGQSMPRDRRQWHGRDLGRNLLDLRHLMQHGWTIIEYGDRFNRDGGIAVHTAAIPIVHGGCEEPYQVERKLLWALEELAFDRVSRNPKVLRFLVEPIASREVD